MSKKEKQERQSKIPIEMSDNKGRNKAVQIPTPTIPCFLFDQKFHATSPGAISMRPRSNDRDLSNYALIK